MKFAVISLAVLSLVALVASVFSAPSTEDLDRLPELGEWEAFKSKHMKSYPSAEHESHRKSIYAANKKKVTDHNDKLGRGKSDQHLRLNHLADLTDEEYLHMCGGKALPHQDREAFEIFVPTVGDSRALPTSVDWRSKGAVTPVKDQGSCGSCWAFSATGALEGQWFLKKGKLVSLSEQNLVDCSTAPPNNGCDGGHPVPAFQYIWKNGGIDTGAAYPYDSMYTENGRNTCRFKSSGVGAKDSGFVQIAPGNEAALKEAVANIGPISAMIDATPLNVKFPPEGVIGINDSTCKTGPMELLNHFVLVVGYGTLKGKTPNEDQDYWLIKNSWGTGWGDKGYAMMARNKKNYCGIATSATYPKVI